MRDIALSPDGAKVALALRSGNEAQGDVLTIVEVGAADSRSEPVKFSLGERDRVSINWLDWASPKRVLVGVTVDDGSDDSIPSRRIMAIDADGSNPRMLFENQPRPAATSIGLDRVVGRVPGETSQVLMPAWTGHSYNLFRVDVDSGCGNTDRPRAYRNLRMAGRRRPGRHCATTRTTVAQRCGCMATRARTTTSWSLIAKYGRVT